MTINNEKIVCFAVEGYEGGFVKRGFKTIKETYDFIQRLKETDKKIGFVDAYYVTIETDKNNYGDYKVYKYKNKYKLKLID